MTRLALRSCVGAFCGAIILHTRTEYKSVQKVAAQRTPYTYTLGSGPGNTHNS